MTKSFIVILEPANYSQQALDNYAILGSLYLHDPLTCFSLIPLSVRKSCIGIVIRLGFFVDSCLLDHFPSLQFVATPTTGTTHIDLISLSIRQIQLFTLNDVPSAIQSVTSTSELAFALAISLIRQLPSAVTNTRSLGVYERDAFCGRQLSSLTVGVLGYGRLGKQFSNLCSSLRASVLYYDINPDVINDPNDMAKPVSLETLISSCDLISIHASFMHPYLPIFDKLTISKIKAGAYIVNTARGELVDEEALCAAIKSNHLAGYATDVISGDSLNNFDLNSNCLYQLSTQGYNVLITPHIGGCTFDGMRLTENVLSSFILKYYGAP